MSMSLQERIESSRETMKDYQRERLEMEVTELICQLMEEKNVSRAELARRLGKSRPYVTKLLRDGSNMTLKTISDVFFALGRSLRVVDRPLSIHSHRLLVVEALPEEARVVMEASPRVVQAANYHFEHPDNQFVCSPVTTGVLYPPEAA